MRRHGRLAVTLLVLGLGLCTVRPAPAQVTRFRLVVNDACAASALKRAQVADYLLKRVSSWPNGTPVAAVDLSTTSPTRVAISRDVLGKSVDEVVHYWQQQVFTGRGSPPPVKTEEDALAMVASTPGAIAYVGGEAVLPRGVKVLHLAD